MDGENLYIPRIENTRKDWGQQTQIKEELKQRNQSIFMEYQAGYAICELSRKYFLFFRKSLFLLSINSSISCSIIIIQKPPLMGG